MASLKKLAGQTAWYGLSSILARFLNYLLTPYLTYYLTKEMYGEMSLVYAAIPFMNVIFTYGMETTFFRYSNKDVDRQTVFNTSTLSVLFTSISLTALLLLFRLPLADLLRVSNHPEFITWAAYIIAFDAIATIPFAKLRLDGRPRKYAFIRVFGILVNIGLVVFFYSILPGIAKNDPGSFLAKWYHPELGAGYVILANLVQSAVTLILLFPELFSVKIQWDKKLWREMMVYSLPIMVAGLGGMINETFDRIMLGWWTPGGEAAAKAEVGIYSACYKLSILITLFIQAFRLGAEPFFFAQAKGEDAPKTYARVMRYFVITICLMFLAVALYIDIWKQFIRNEEMWVGLKVVPILLVANMFLGVYYNLSIWYKLSHNTRAGATITFIGAGVTLLINFLFIPTYGYMACAWATLACYGSMMVISYFWGQKVYPVPYPTAALLRMFVAMLLVYIGHLFLIQYLPGLGMRLLSGTVMMMLFLGYIIRTEKEQLKRIPVINKLVR